MNVLHIVAGELTGGAARGAYWLHNGLRELGVESLIYTNSTETFADDTVISTTQTNTAKYVSLFRSLIDPFLLKLFYRNQSKKAGFSTGLWGQDFTKTKVYQDADIIHLHWICNGFVNIKHLKKIKKPIAWSLRDMWPMTGGCHIAEALNCDNYKSGCGFCKLLESSYKYDASYFLLRRKMKYIPTNTKLIGISHWITDQAKQSMIFRNYDIRTIYNNVNTNDFFPVDKKIAKSILGINTNKKIVLANVVAEKKFYKGLHKYQEAILRLDPSHYYLTFFGKPDLLFNAKLLERGFECRNHNYVHDIISLRLIYSSADVFVAPSIIESFGKTIIEAMACGTPVVCFDSTGPREIVTHKIDGYKAMPFDVQSLFEGITWVLNTPIYDSLTMNAREKVKNNFDSLIIAEKYIKLYKQMLSYKYTAI